MRTFILKLLQKIGLKKENLKMNNKERLTKQLDNFLFDKNNKKEDGFVISIQGHWGIGKTYFWNDYIKHKEQEDKFVNISLFGIHTLDDIKKKILLKTSDRFKLNDKIGKILGTSKFLGFDLASMVSIISKEEFKEIIICFDDFERISPNLSMSEILGFISELKEEYSCKIILINNNDTLKEQDTLNHKKIIKRAVKSEKKQKNLLITEEEKYIITATNNEEIFNKYIEKIVDVTLWYEPTLKDIVQIVSELNKEKKYIDFNILENLFSQLSNRDKKFNIRFMKQIVLKLELLEDILIEKDINVKIKNGIFLNIFESVIKEKINYHNLNIPIITPFNKEYFIDIEKRHHIDIEKLKAEIKKPNDYLNSEEYNSSLRKKIEETYFKYLYDLSYEDKKFSEDFYLLLNKLNVDIVRLLSYTSFASYIKLFKKIDSNNNERYQKLFIEKSKEYIKNDIQHLDIDRLYENNKFIEELDRNNELKKFYEEEKQKIKIEKSLDKKSIKELIEKKLNSNGWNHSEELLLGNISSIQHTEWLIEDREYFELTFNFMNYLNNFSGDKAFKEFYNKTTNIYKVLYKQEKYKNKIEFILPRFGIEIEG